MTAQEFFDRTAKHLLTQRECSCLGDDCLYRGPRGLKCVIGFWIPDERYHPSLEGRMLDLEILDLAGVPHELYQLAIDLQEMHDKKDSTRWRWHLRLLAAKYKLKEDVLL